MSPQLRYEEVRKEFKSPSGTVAALNSVSFEIQDGELFCLLGPSGCGKTTLLRCTAGLETLASGRILYGGTDFSIIPPFRRNIGMVFQSYALYPHMSVFENVAYPLRIHKVPRKEIARRVNGIMELVRLPEVLDRNPSQLSGGQQQRIALARALVYEPGLLLLDEPLANLDAKLKVQMRAEIRRIQKTANVTAIYVTHDQPEAMAIGDRLAIMELGYVRQIGSPGEIYSEPANQFVAGFIGEMNFFDGRVKAFDDSTVQVKIGSFVKSSKLLEHAKVDADRVVVALRPQCLYVAAVDKGCFEGEVQVIQFLGMFIRYHVLISCEGGVFPVEIDMATPLEGIREGDRVSIDFDDADAFVYSNGERIA